MRLLLVVHMAPAITQQDNHERAHRKFFATKLLTNPFKRSHFNMNVAQILLTPFSPCMHMRVMIKFNINYFIL